jgi:teichoic acid transport system ATP-binding protein
VADIDTQSSSLTDTHMQRTVREWTEEELRRRHQLVEHENIRLGPPTPTHAMRRIWRQKARGMEDRVTVVVDDVHITYKVYEDRKRPKARDRFAGKGSREYREIHAVRGVSFEARSGESIGIIGRNGSGKSTLLQGMAGLLPVDKGRILAHSQPSLLGVGAVLQPGLSGRRNIMLGTLALGMSKAEAESQVDEITEFAGLEEYIDLPMRTYSSGMKARLQFSIATSVRPEILMIDEALAVGDEIFKRRSDERIRELQDAAGTIFIVSHGLEGIIDSCTRVIWLEQGRMVADGDPREIISEYRDKVAHEVRQDRRKRRGKGRGKGRGGGQGRNRAGQDGQQGGGRGAQGAGQRQHQQDGDGPGWNGPRA